MQTNNNQGDLVRTASRHGLAYVIGSIGELFRHYKFHPIDLLIIQAVLHFTTLNAMDDLEFDRQLDSVLTGSPDAVKQGVSRSALCDFFNLPIETIRRRVTGLKKLGVLLEREDGLIVPENDLFEFGTNEDLLRVSVSQLRKLLKDLAGAGIHSADHLVTMMRGGRNP